MLYFIYLKVNLLSVSSFEHEIYAVAFQNVQVLLYSMEATPDTTIVLEVHKERLYRLLGRPIVLSNVLLDSTSDLISYSTSMLEELSEVGTCKIPSSTMGRMSP
jgi:hypothetical protein